MTTISSYRITLTFQDEWLKLNTVTLYHREGIDPLSRRFLAVESRIARIVRRGYPHLIQEILPRDSAALLLKGMYDAQSEEEIPPLQRDFKGLCSFLRLYGEIRIEPSTTPPEEKREEDARVPGDALERRVEASLS